jgi:EF-P beta-lysylation protein EpmB
MIAATLTSSQQHTNQAITDPAELLETLGLDPKLLPAAREASRQFPLRVPRGYVARMRQGDPADPLLRQVLPIGAELESAPGFSADPVGDLASRVTAGVLHKYESRALLIATESCAIHCRYCFRRHFPYSEELASRNGWRDALHVLRTNTSLREVILSGGDPLSLSDRRLTQLTDALAEIPHIKRLRIHTRQPIVLPERIDAQFLEWFAALRLRKVVVLHANHAQEIDAEVERACRDLTRAGATLLNQSVLLAGVNDSAEALHALSERLFDVGALPYYLHLLDRVAGAAHYEVTETRAREIMLSLTASLPGFLVPKLVREIPGEPSKTPVAMHYNPG